MFLVFLVTDYCLLRKNINLPRCKHLQISIKVTDQCMRYCSYPFAYNPCKVSLVSYSRFPMHSTEGTEVNERDRIILHKLSYNNGPKRLRFLRLPL